MKIAHEGCEVYVFFSQYFSIWSENFNDDLRNKHVSVRFGSRLQWQIFQLGGVSALMRCPLRGSRRLIFSRVSLGAALTKCFSGGRAGNCWPDQPPCFQGNSGYSTIPTNFELHCDDNKLKFGFAGNTVPLNRKHFVLLDLWMAWMNEKSERLKTDCRECITAWKSLADSKSFNL